MEQAPPSLPVRKAKWPAVFGIIAIVFGGFGILGGPIQIFGAKMNTNSMQQFEDSGIELREGFEDEYNSAAMMYGISASTLALILLIGGILLVRRKKPGSPVLQVWAILKLSIGIFVMVKFSTINNEFAQMTMQQALQVAGDAGQELKMIGTAMSVGSIVGLVFGILWLAALPVILLIFLNRPKAKQEMATW